MPPTKSTPLHWTLRLKYHKSTVLLSVDPLQSIQKLKGDLLDALQNLISPLNDVESLPNSPSQVQLAKPIDVLDASAGWQRIDKTDEPKFDDVDELAADDDDDAGVSRRRSKSKGKAKKGTSNGTDGDQRTLKECGISDNAVLAFKFAPHLEDNEEAMDEDDNDKWDVVIPTYEDTYGVENEGDVGQFKEYRG